MGEGGTAIVSGGMDALLRRRVAIKVLRPQFAGDAEFVRRFYHEAESAARLSHPNIVSIYDVGREHDTYYIVMELVDGDSLAHQITSRGALPERVVLDYALQICSGLGYAHRQGILHRDIKPANILLTRDEIIKISDFGIARAVERQTLVMTAHGHFMGSVSYLSPEQAQDRELLPTSDLYSLGVVMYELLSGRLPFVADAPIAVALKHLSDMPPPLPVDISPALADIVMRLLAKEPSERYQSAEILAAALRGARESTSAVAARATAERPVTPPVVEVPNPPPRRSPMPDRPNLRTETPRKRGFAPFVLLMLLVLVGLGIGYVLTARPLFALHGHVVEMPSEVGATLADAETGLNAAGFSTRVEAIASETIPSGHIVAQDPAAGTSVSTGATVTLRVSSGLPLVEVPDLRSFSSEDAQKLLTEQNLTVKITSRYDERVPKDSVIAQQPAPHLRLRERAPVTLLISNGPQPITVPNLVSQSLSGARAVMEKLHVSVEVGDQTSSDVIAAGTIASQDPPPGATLEPGGSVTVTVSSGPAMATIPDLTSSRLEDAQATLQGAGLTAQLRYTVQSGVADGTIIGQNPGAGSSAKRGSSVALVVAVSGTVPDVGGMTLDSARAALQDAGYQVGNVAQTQEGLDGKVARTEPSAGTPLRPGESVVIYQNIAVPDGQPSSGDQ